MTRGSLVSMLAVFVELASGSLPCNLIFLASAEEENTGMWRDSKRVSGTWAG